MTHSWRGKQSTAAKKEESTPITKFKNNSEDIRVNGSGNKQMFIRLLHYRFPEKSALCPHVLWHRQRKEGPLRV